MKIFKTLTILHVITLTTLYAQSFEKHEIDCDAGNAQACYEAAKIYSNEAYKEKNYDRSKAANKVAQLYKRSCELGYAKGCTSYAMAYASDMQQETNKDIEYYLQKACEHGDNTGCTMLKMLPSRK
jgi:TPR repeat protein